MFFSWMISRQEKAAIYLDKLSQWNLSVVSPLPSKSPVLPPSNPNWKKKKSLRTTPTIIIKIKHCKEPVSKNWSSTKISKSKPRPVSPPCWLARVNQKQSTLTQKSPCLLKWNPWPPLLASPYQFWGSFFALWSQFQWVSSTDSYRVHSANIYTLLFQGLSSRIYHLGSLQIFTSWCPCCWATFRWSCFGLTVESLRFYLDSAI